MLADPVAERLRNVADATLLALDETDTVAEMLALPLEDTLRPGDREADVEGVVSMVGPRRDAFDELVGDVTGVTVDSAAVGVRRDDVRGDALGQEENFADTEYDGEPLSLRESPRAILALSVSLLFGL